jgi:hypothetical protein
LLLHAALAKTSKLAHAKTFHRALYSSFILSSSFKTYSRTWATIPTNESDVTPCFSPRMASRSRAHQGTSQKKPVGMPKKNLQTSPLLQSAFPLVSQSQYPNTQVFEMQSESLKHIWRVASQTLLLHSSVPGQSLSLTHSTQVLLFVAQRGAPPEQSPSERHCTH